MTIKNIKNNMMNLPTPSNISYLWNFGSMLGMLFIIQIMTGIVLSMQYSNEVTSSFQSINHIMRDVNYGWWIRYSHSNGASLIFITMYLHIARGLYYKSFNFKKTWSIGVMIYLLTMMTAFMGYVLPWGQMSFWGATVITNLISAVPYIGKEITMWVWGGFSVSGPTLNRLFTLHFVIPLIIMLMATIHIMFLHETGSSNPLGICSNKDKISLTPFFSTKDLITILLSLIMMMLMISEYPNLFADPENFISANPMSTPNHIKPEWYFLFAYAILRSIPSKIGGVMAMIFSILVLLTTMSFKQMNSFTSTNFYPISKTMFNIFNVNFILLTWIGANAIEYPYMEIGMLSSTLYFLFFILNPIMTWYYNKIIYK